MSANLKKNLPRLQAVCDVKSPELRHALIKDYCRDDCFCRAVTEVARNTVKRNLPLDAKAINRLRRHKKAILDFVPKLGQAKRRELAAQSGGFLPVVVPILASLIGEIFRQNE
jgi:hypothetical protein